MSLTGRVFTNRYEIQRELAQGGMAEVYLARDRMLERNVALKALFPEFAREPSFVERFRREAQAAANLNHPNIVAIYDWGQESGTYFIVMEAVEGRSLRDLIRGEAPLDPGQSADICSEIASALAVAHRNGVVHRDVKPGNVLITPTGDVKVTDFGIARAGTTDGLTQTGSVMGTATYFSPEQAQGFDVDGRSDVYSLGVVLYEMVTGVAPFTGDSPVAVAYKHVREAPVPPSQRNPGIPDDLETIILTAMAKDPDHRYQSAEDMRADLVRFRRGRPLAAVPVTAALEEYDDRTEVAAPVATRTAVGPAVAYEPRRRGGTFAALATVLILVAAVAALLWFTSGQDEGAETAIVPSVVGLDVESATEQLEEAGFEVDASDQVANEDIPEGEVISQDPEGDTEATLGDTVVLTVSAGVGKVEVPELVNSNIFQAVAALEEIGLRSESVAVNDDVIAPGTVMSTDPPGGTEVDKGSVVVLTVSEGAETVPIPDVVGEDADSAFEELTAAGFRIEQQAENSSSVEAGLVIRTEPEATTEHPVGSEVIMVVSTGPALSGVPSVIGLGEVDAEVELRASGFTVTKVEVDTSAINDGRVVDQSPAPGAQVEPGTNVTISIGRFTEPTTTLPPTTTTTVAPTTVAPTTPTT